MSPRTGLRTPWGGDRRSQPERGAGQMPVGWRSLEVALGGGVLPGGGGAVRTAGGVGGVHTQLLTTEWTPWWRKEARDGHEESAIFREHQTPCFRMKLVGTVFAGNHLSHQL